MTAGRRITALKVFGLEASLIECRLETGRTHQIRVHMAHKGNSIVGDPVYGRGIKRGAGDDISQVIKDFDRQALHASVLGFAHPITKVPIRFEVGVPSDWDDLLSVFKGMY